MRPRISLYIPCFNSERYVAPTIEAALRQTLVPDEILIIDGGSANRTVEVAARYPVRIIRQEYNKGVAADRNTAIRHSRNDLVAAIDADCVAAPDWLEKLAAVFDDPNVALAGGMLREGVLDSAADRWRQVHMPQDWGNERLLNPSFVYGHSTMVRKKVVEECGWYGEELRLSGEDMDISRKIRARGYNTIYEPAAQVTHLRQDTVRSVMATYWKWNWYGIDRMRLGYILYRVLYLHFRPNLCRFLHEDVRRKNYGLLWLDFLTLFYMPYFDFRLFLRTIGTNTPRVAGTVAEEQ